METKAMKKVLISLSIITLLVFLIPFHSQAVDKYWIDGTSWWDYSSNWSPVGQPQNGDNVYLTQSDATNRTVYYWNTLYPSAVLSLLKIDATGTGTMTLSQGKDPLASYDEYIGYSGTGTFKQTGGTNTVTNTLTIAATPGSSGTYDLSGGILTAYNIVNNDTFNQSGGTINGPLQNNKTFNYSGGIFNGRLINNGVANFNADFTAGNGMEQNTDLTIPSGITIALNGQGLDNQGSITLAGGTWGGTGPLVNNGLITGFGTITGSGGFTNTWLLKHSDGNLILANTGTNTNYGSIILAGAPYRFEIQGAEGIKPEEAAIWLPLF